eukprot:Lithocolla_globosa_v1_NODE_175_length_5452_cov_75.708094.p1 type:complete len:929 gc:universal NODE_175_length_5452_cov_75.708094:749-3535(+)
MSVSIELTNNIETYLANVLQTATWSADSTIEGVKVSDWFDSHFHLNDSTFTLIGKHVKDFDQEQLGRCVGRLAKQLASIALRQILNQASVTFTNINTPPAYWYEYVSQEIYDQTDKAERKRQEVMYEIVETERQYLADLNLLVQFFMNPINSGEIQILTPNFYNIVFFGVKDTINNNMKLLEDLFARQRESPRMEGLGDIFSKHMDIFDNYVACSLNQIEAIQLVNKEKRDNPEFEQWLTERYHMPQTRKLPLKSYLDRSRTRFARYPLILTSLIQATPPNHPDYAHLSDVIAKFKKMLSALDEQTSATETRVHLNNIANNYIVTDFGQSELSFLDLRNPNRRLLRQGILKQGKVGVRLMYLFDHAILVARSGDNSQVIQQHMWPLESMIVVSEQQTDISLRANSSPILSSGKTHLHLPAPSLKVPEKAMKSSRSFESVHRAPISTVRSSMEVGAARSNSQEVDQFVIRHMSGVTESFRCENSKGSNDWVKAIQKAQEDLLQTKGFLSKHLGTFRTIAQIHSIQRIQLPEHCMPKLAQSVNPNTNINHNNNNNDQDLKDTKEKHRKIGPSLSLSDSDVDIDNSQQPTFDALMIAADDGLYLGYPVFDRHQEYVFKRIIQLEKVTQAEVIESCGIVVVCANSHLLLYPISILRPTGTVNQQQIHHTVPHSQGTTWFKTGTLSRISSSIYLVLIKSKERFRSLKLYSIEEEVFSPKLEQLYSIETLLSRKFNKIKKFEIPGTPQSIMFLSSFLCVTTEQGYTQIDVLTSKVADICHPDDPSLAAAMPVDSFTPLAMLKIPTLEEGQVKAISQGSEGVSGKLKEFLLCSKEGKSTFINANGQRSRNMLVQWKTLLNSVCLFDNRHLCGFGNHFLEILEVDTGKQTAILPFPSGVQLFSKPDVGCGNHEKKMPLLVATSSTEGWRLAEIVKN